MFQPIFLIKLNIHTQTRTNYIHHLNRLKALNLTVTRRKQIQLYDTGLGGGTVEETYEKKSKNRII